jgi:hypothetical protein
MAGLDPFDGDTKPKPPDGKLWEVEQGIGAGEGDAVKGADGESPTSERMKGPETAPGWVQSSKPLPERFYTTKTRSGHAR